MKGKIYQVLLDSALRVRDVVSMSCWQIGVGGQIYLPHSTNEAQRLRAEYVPPMSSLS